jgi:hypothetical protein
VAAQAPAAIGCLGEQDPRPAGERRVAGGVRGDAREPLDDGQLLAAVERAGVGEHLYTDVVALAVDVGQAPGRQLVDEGRRILPEHRDVRYLLDGHDGRREVGGELVRVVECPGRRVDVDHGHGGTP